MGAVLFREDTFDGGRLWFRHFPLGYVYATYGVLTFIPAASVTLAATLSHPLYSVSPNRATTQDWSAVSPSLLQASTTVSLLCAVLGVLSLRWSFFGRRFRVRP